MKVIVLSLFPDFIKAGFEYSILKRAREKGFWDYEIVDFRNFTTDKYRTVDDYPYGGGAGMILKPEPINEALSSFKFDNEKTKVILTTPQGEVFNHKMAAKLSLMDELVFICGHYKGVDARLKKKYNLLEISIGDFVLTGGELAALVMTDAIVRLIPGVVGNGESALTDSFINDGLLDCDYFTRPPIWENMRVPKVLRDGNHRKIEIWRRWNSLYLTWKNRPDLLINADLTKEEKNAIEKWNKKREDEKK